MFRSAVTSVLELRTSKKLKARCAVVLRPVLRSKHKVARQLLPLRRRHSSCDQPGLATLMTCPEQHTP